MLRGGWREGVLWSGSFRPGQSRWSLGVGGRVMKRDGAGSWALHWFSILAALKRDGAGCMASAGGAAQGDEEPGEGLGLGVWEVGDPARLRRAAVGIGAGVPVRPGLVPVALDPSHLLPERVKQARGWWWVLIRASSSPTATQMNRAKPRDPHGRQFTPEVTVGVGWAGTPARLLRAPARDSVTSGHRPARDSMTSGHLPAAEAVEGLVGAPCGAWTSGKPSHLLSESRMWTQELYFRGFQCVWCDSQVALSVQSVTFRGT